MLTSNIRKTVLAVAALALFPGLALAQTGDMAKPAAAPASSATVQTSAPAVGAKAGVKTAVKTHHAKAHKIAKLMKLRHHKKMTTARLHKKALGKTASVPAGGAMKAKTATK